MLLKYDESIESECVYVMPTSIRLDPATEQRLDVLAAKTGRTKAFYLREFIERGLDDLEDAYLADAVLERVRQGRESVHTDQAVREQLGRDD